MSNLFKDVPGFVTLTYGAFSEGYDAAVQSLDDYTRYLWRISCWPRWRRRKVLQAIGDIEIPEQVSYVVWKRSFPFWSPKYYPKFSDVLACSEKARLVVMSRELPSCAASLLRRNLGRDIQNAAHRTLKARQALLHELTHLSQESFFIVDFDRLITSPREGLTQMAAFIGCPAEALTAQIHSIGTPTAAAQTIREKHATFLGDYFQPADSLSLRLCYPDRVIN